MVYYLIILSLLLIYVNSQWKYNYSTILTQTGYRFTSFIPISSYVFATGETENGKTALFYKKNQNNYETVAIDGSNEFSYLSDVIRVSDNDFIICADNNQLYHFYLSSNEITGIEMDNFSQVSHASKLICRHDETQHLIYIAYVDTSYYGIYDPVSNTLEIKDLEYIIKSFDVYVTVIDENTKNTKTSFISRLQTSEYFYYHTSDSLRTIPLNTSYGDNVMLYDTIKITITSDTIYLISYSTIVFNYYIINSDLTVKLTGYSFINDGLSNVHYQTISFFNNTPYIFYLYFHNDLSYYGVSDIEYQYVISYETLHSHDIALVKYTNIINVSSIAVIQGDGVKIALNAIKKITSDDNNNYLICDFSSNQFLTVSGTENTCEHCTKNILGRKYCVDSCPNGNKDVEGNCVLCNDSNKYYDTNTSQCVDKCDNNKGVGVHGICKDCEKYKNKNNNYCVDDCYHMTYSSDNNCSSCNQYYNPYSYECVNTCPVPLTGIGQIHHCQKCARFYENGHCVDHCSSGKGIIKSTNSNECVQCKAQGGYLLNAHCVKYFNKLRYCYNDETGILQKINSYIEIPSGKCVANCGENQEKKDKQCTVCRLTEKKYYSNIGNSCLTECPIYEVHDDNFRCYKCSDISQVYEIFSGKCYSTPEDNWRGVSADVYLNCALNTNNNILYDKKSGNCVAGCGQYDEKKDSKICIDCAYYQQFGEKGRCVDSCLPGSIIHFNIGNTCEKCQDTNQYYYNGSCISECVNMVYDSNNICFMCSEKYPHEKEFYYNKECYGSCPSGTEFDATLGDRKVCSLCKDRADNNKYYYDGKCISECPDNFAFDANTLICYNCKDKTLFYDPKTKQCTDICPDTTCHLTDPIYNVCTCCADPTPFFYDNTCLDSCPKGSINNEYNTCIKCVDTENTFYIDKNNPDLSVCTKDCNAYDSDIYEIDDENKSCKSCLSYDGYHLDIPGKTKCGTSCAYCSNGKRCYLCNKCQKIDPEESLIGNPETDSCVETCGKGMIVTVSNECYNCDGDGKYKYNNECVDQCPVDYIQNNSNECITCPGVIFNNNCLTECPYNYGVGDSVKECKKCINLSKYYSETNMKCVPDCEDNEEKIEKSKLCKSVFIPSCLSDCFDNGVCDPITSICNCNPGYEGDNCQIQTPSSTTTLVIKSAKSNVIIDQINEFYFITDLITLAVDIEWDLVNANGNKNANNANLFLNGFNEERFKIQKNVFTQGTNTVKLHIKSTTMSYQTELNIFIRPGDLSSFTSTIEYLSENATAVAVAMKTIVIITAFPNDSHTYLYQYYYECPTTKTKLLMQSKASDTRKYTSYLPMTKTVFIRVTDSGGQSGFISISVNVVSNSEIEEGSVDDIGDPTKPPDEQLLGLNTLLNGSTELSKEDLDKIADYLNESLSNDTPIEGVMNTIDIGIGIKDVINVDSDTFYDGVGNLIKNATEAFPEKGLSKDELSNVYDIVNNFLNAFNNNDETSVHTNMKTSTAVKDSLENLNNCLSHTLAPGESLTVQTNNFNIYITRPGKNQNGLSFTTPSGEPENTIQNNKNDNNPSCLGGTLFCINPDDFDDFSKSLDGIKNSVVQNVTFNLITINNEKFYGTNKTLTTQTVIANVYNLDKNETVNDLSIKYTIEIPIDTADINTDKSSAYNSSCASMGKTSKNTFCKTYFNYTSSTMICKCQGSGEITGGFDYTITNLNKLLQFPQLTLGLINPLSMCIISTALVGISFFSVVLLVLDYRDDKKSLMGRKSNDHGIFYSTFIDMDGGFNGNIFRLTWYITCNTYIFLAMFNVYDYNQPRFIRFTIEIMTMMVSGVFSLIPYYKDTFDLKEDIIEARDIEDIGLDGSNLPARILDIIATILYSLCATIITVIIIKIFSFLLSYDTVLCVIWEKKYKMLIKYVNKYIMFSDATKKVITAGNVRNKLNALSFFVNKYQERGDKKQRDQEEIDRLIHDGGNKKFRNSNVGGSSTAMKKRFSSIKVPSFYIERCSEMWGNVKEDEEPEDCENVALKVNYAASSTDNNRRIYTINNSNKLTSSRSYRLNKRSSLFTTQHRASKNEKCKYYEMYHIGSLTVHNTQPNSLCTKQLKREIKSIVLTIISIIIIISLFLGIFLLLTIILEDIYNRYEFYIVKVWLFPSGLQLLLMRLVTAYGINFAYNCVLFFYDKDSDRRSWLINFLYTIVPDDGVFAFKISRTLDKYQDTGRKGIKKHLIEDMKNTVLIW